MIRAVLDTNIIVSALLSPSGPPAQVLLAALSGDIQLCVSGAVYAEYEEVLSRPRLRFGPATIASTLQSIRTLGRWARPVEEVRVCVDPDDNIFLECAAAASAEYVITGNIRHYPALWRGIEVVTPADFLATLSRNRRA